jgi:hypothetical protein
MDQACRCHAPEEAGAEALLTVIRLAAATSLAASQRRANGPIVSPWTRMLTGLCALNQSRG